MGELLRHHPLTRGLLEALDGQPRTFAEIIEAFPRRGVGWGSVFRTRPEVTARALARFVGLLAQARDPDAPAGSSRPLLNVEVHLWVRAVSRLLRAVSTGVAFGWHGEPPRELDRYASEADLVVADPGSRCCRRSTAGTAGGPGGLASRRSGIHTTWTRTRTGFTAPAWGGTSDGCGC